MKDCLDDVLPHAIQPNHPSIDSPNAPSLNGVGQPPQAPTPSNDIPTPHPYLVQATPQQVSAINPYIKPDDTEKAVLDADVSLMNFTTHMMLQAWQLPMGVKGVIELADATQRLIKNRRDTMNMQYGSSIKTTKNGSFEVLD